MQPVANDFVTTVATQRMRKTYCLYLLDLVILNKMYSGFGQDH
jgi:hypothetical protein